MQRNLKQFRESDRKWWWGEKFHVESTLRLGKLSQETSLLNTGCCKLIRSWGTRRVPGSLIVFNHVQVRKEFSNMILSSGQNNEGRDSGPFSFSTTRPKTRKGSKFSSLWAFRSFKDEFLRQLHALCHSPLLQVWNQWAGDSSTNSSSGRTKRSWRLHRLQVLQDVQGRGSLYWPSTFEAQSNNRRESWKAWSKEEECGWYQRQWVF